MLIFHDHLVRAHLAESRADLLRGHRVRRLAATARAARSVEREILRARRVLARAIPTDR